MFRTDRRYLFFQYFSCVLLLLVLSCGGDEDGDGEESVSDKCEGVTCSGHGKCVTVYGSPTCACERGYVADGLTCVEDTSQSDSNGESETGRNNTQTGTSCKASCPKVCDEGECVECTDDRHCIGRKICRSSDNKCVECKLDAHCREGTCHAGAGNCPLNDHEGACQRRTDRATCNNGVCNCPPAENYLGDECRCEWAPE